MDEAIARASILRSVDPATASALIAQFTAVEFAAGSHIFHEDDPGDQLYIIGSGKVKFSRRSPDGREHVVTVMGPSDMFGELAVFDPAPRTSTATALTDVSAVTLDRDAICGLITSRPGVAEQLLRILARRVRRTNDNVADLVLVDVPGRVARKLLSLAQRFGYQEDGHVRLIHHLSRTELAQLVGATPESVDRALTDFHRKGWLRVEDQAVVIVNSDRLQQCAALVP
ncbi:Crp/Fnr family transcriptional regulator [Mycobacterium sp. DSM 3803]|nr:Crp/Fnr family transcriptional regulator [Mycobacterium sp. DSM 3803]